MGVRIENQPNELLIYDRDTKSIDYVNKEGLVVSGVNGAVSLVNLSQGFSKSITPDKLEEPATNGLYGIVTTLKSYASSSASEAGLLGGWGDYNDYVTIASPISITGGAGYVDLTNDKLGVYTREDYLPFGVPTLWNSTTNRSDFSTLSVGDVGQVRVDIELVTLSVNTDFEVTLEFGTGGSVFTIPILNLSSFKTAGTYHLSGVSNYYIGSKDVIDNGFRVRAKADTTCTVTVNGFLINVTKRA